LKKEEIRDPIDDILLNEDGIDIPPIFGYIHINFPFEPVSNQTKKIKKEIFKNKVKDKIKPFKYILTGDVKIDIEWRLNEKVRYETDSSPDIDNIIKPLMDALCGPDGILVDDCQLQAITCYWIDIYSEEEFFNITIRCDPDLYIKKDKNLVYCQLDNGLCWPINMKYPKEVLILFINHIEKIINIDKDYPEMFKDLTEIERYYFKKYLLPLQPLFHRTRVSRFKVIGIEQLRKTIDIL